MGLAYLVICASCGALLFQNIGQKYTAPPPPPCSSPWRPPSACSSPSSSPMSGPPPHVRGLCADLHRRGVLRDQILLPAQKKS
ncbi:hypothetical protein M5E87_14460 [Flavonifractor plautii]|nr:hypothetical protein M5E87_14460 [Flavonifractor plautii]